MHFGSGDVIISLYHVCIYEFQLLCEGWRKGKCTMLHVCILDLSFSHLQHDEGVFNVYTKGEEGREKK